MLIEAAIGFGVFFLDPVSESHWCFFHIRTHSFFISFFLTDSDKNGLAMDTINSFIGQCCWMNIHIVPPHGEVFEIRVVQGYGARWSRDGTKVLLLLAFMKLWMIFSLTFWSTIGLLIGESVMFFAVHWISWALQWRWPLHGLEALDESIFVPNKM